LRTVRRVESHQINRNHELFNFCDDITYKSKNLYNAILYRIQYKKHFKDEDFKNSSSYFYKRYKYLDEYKILKENKQTYFVNYICKRIADDYNNTWKNINKNGKDINGNDIKFPKFKEAGEKGRFEAGFQVNKKKAEKILKGKKSKIKIPGIKYYIKPYISDKFMIKQVVIEPSHRKYHRNIYFKLKICYEKEIPDKPEKVKNIAGIDLGKGNLATIATNIRIKPIAINGNPLCQWGDAYLNKRKSLMSYVKGKGTSNRIKRLDKKYKNKVKNYIHNASRKIVDWCNENDIDTIVIGKNKNWKQEINIGKQNNYHFTIIPFNMLIEQIKYKAEEYGIKTEMTEEACTSKANFLNNDPIPNYDTYKEDKKNMRSSLLGVKNTKDIGDYIKQTMILL
jgi:putative transposase